MSVRSFDGVLAGSPNSPSSPHSPVYDEPNTAEAFQRHVSQVWEKGFYERDPEKAAQFQRTAELAAPRLTDQTGLKEAGRVFHVAAVEAQKITKKEKLCDRILSILCCLCGYRSRFLVTPLARDPEAPSGATDDHSLRTLARFDG